MDPLSKDTPNWRRPVYNGQESCKVIADIVYKVIPKMMTVSEGLRCFTEIFTAVIISYLFIF